MPLDTGGIKQLGIGKNTDLIIPSKLCQTKFVYLQSIIYIVAVTNNAISKSSSFFLEGLRSLLLKVVNPLIKENTNRSIQNVLRNHKWLARRVTKYYAGFLS